MTDTPRTEPERSDLLEVSFDDDTPEDTPPAPIAIDALVVEIDGDDDPPSTPWQGGIVIDVDSDDAFPGMPAMRSDFEFSADDLDHGAALPGFRTPPTGEIITKKGVATRAADEPISHQHILILGVAGLLGGLFGWMLSEPFQYLIGSVGLGSLVLQAMMLAGLVGLGIGAVLDTTPGLSVGVLGKAGKGFLVGALFGLLGGMLGGSLAQLVYGATSLELAKGTPAMMLLPVGQVLLRAVGWSIMGLFFGLGQAALITEEKKMRNGLLGGAIGGFLGGIAFELIMRSGVGNAGLGRCLAFSVLGATIGILIGLIEEAAKEAWLSVIGGPLAGKQFILYEAHTTIGSSPKSGITLLKDPAVAPEHAAIVHQGGEFILTHLAPGAVTLVNGRPAMRHLLEDGDTITIGSTQMAFCARAKTEKEQQKGYAGGVW